MPTLDSDRESLSLTFSSPKAVWPKQSPLPRDRLSLRRSTSPLQSPGDRLHDVATPSAACRTERLRQDFLNISPLMPRRFNGVVLDGPPVDMASLFPRLKIDFKIPQKKRNDVPSASKV